MSETASVETPRESPKQASAPVIAQHAVTLKALPFSDMRDFDDAARGFLGRKHRALGRILHTREAEHALLRRRQRIMRFVVYQNAHRIARFPAMRSTTKSSLT